MNQDIKALRRLVGANIHALRARQRVTLQKLAKETGVPEWLLDRWEIGGKDITLYDMLRVARALGAEVGILLRGESK